MFQLFTEQLLMIFGFHRLQAIGTEAVHKLLADVIALRFIEGYGGALAEQDGPDLAFEILVTAGAIFLFVLAHIEKRAGIAPAP